LFVTKLLLKDHLGSMVAEVAITGTVNASGQVTSVSVVANGIVVHGFGPWGNTRNAASPLNGDSRGFTGHEHLAELGLIHMNGRIYDPVIGRFLQADPIIQAPHNAQSHNRYSYVMNNPLSFTDPSGFSWWTRFRSKVAAGVTWVVTAWATSGCIPCANFAANAVRAGMEAHSSGSSVWRTIASSVVGSTLNYFGVPTTVTAGLKTALNGGNRRQIGASMLGAEVGSWFGGGFASAGVGGCVSAAVNRGSCWVGARDAMIAAGIDSARTGAYEYLSSQSSRQAYKTSARNDVSQSEALQRFEREMNRAWDAMRTLPEIAEIERKHGPMRIAVTSGPTQIDSNNVLHVNPTVVFVEYRTKPPETWDLLTSTEYDRRVSSMPDYFPLSPIRLLAHEVFHMTQPNGIAFALGKDHYEWAAIQFENRIINKYFDPNEPARRSHNEWRYRW
jgi:RHS repeat-associated protein